MSNERVNQRLAQIGRQAAYRPPFDMVPMPGGSGDDLSYSCAGTSVIAGSAFDLWRTAASVSADIERVVLARVGMSWPEYMLLYLMCRHAALRAQDAADLLGVGVDQIVATAGQMHVRGWVEVSRAEPGDPVVLTCTVAGDEIATALQDPVIREESRLWPLSALGVMRFRMMLTGAAALANQTLEPENPPAPA